MEGCSNTGGEVHMLETSKVAYCARFLEILVLSRCEIKGADAVRNEEHRLLEDGRCIATNVYISVFGTWVRNGVSI